MCSEPALPNTCLQPYTCPNCYVLKAIGPLQETYALQMPPAQAVNEWQPPQPGLIEQVSETQLPQQSPACAG